MSHAKADSDTAYGCLYCRTGCEQRVIDRIERDYDAIEAIAPYKLRIRRSGGRVSEERALLFPGYVFVRASAKTPLQGLVDHQTVYSLLKGAEDRWPLIGADRDIAERLFQESGVIGFSKAYYEGDRIRIAEGFLKEYEGDIIGVNRRARTAHVRVTLHGIRFDMWLGFELIESV